MTTERNNLFRDLPDPQAVLDASVRRPRLPAPAATTVGQTQSPTISAPALRRSEPRNLRGPTTYRLGGEVASYVADSAFSVVSDRGTHLSRNAFLNAAMNALRRASIDFRQIHDADELEAALLARLKGVPLP